MKKSSTAGSHKYQKSNVQEQEMSLWQVEAENSHTVRREAQSLLSSHLIGSLWELHREAWERRC